MHKTEFLYGLIPSDLDNKEYFTALHFKKEAGVKLYRQLFLKPDKTKEDSDRMFYVERAVRHTERLILERTE